MLGFPLRMIPFIVPKRLIESRITFDWRVKNQLTCIYVAEQVDFVDTSKKARNVDPEILAPAICKSGRRDGFDQFIARSFQ